MRFMDYMLQQQQNDKLDKLAEAALELMGERGREMSPSPGPRPRSRMRSHSRSRANSRFRNSSTSSLVEAQSALSAGTSTSGRRAYEEPGRNAPERGNKPPMWHTLKSAGVTILIKSLNLTGIETAIYEYEFQKWIATYEVTEEMADCPDERLMAEDAVERYLVYLGLEMIECVPGLHFTSIDFGLRNDRHKIVSQAVRLIRRFEEKNGDRGQIIVTIPALEEGVAAASVLENKYSIKTNLTLVSSVTHAAICAEAGASFVTFCDKEIDAVTYLEGIDGICIDERLGEEMKTSVMMWLPRPVTGSPEPLTEVAHSPAPERSAENVSLEIMTARGNSLVEATSAATCRRHDGSWQKLVDLIAEEIKQKRTPLDEACQEYLEDVEEDIRVAWGGEPRPGFQPRTGHFGFRWLQGQMSDSYPPPVSPNRSWRDKGRRKSRPASLYNIFATT
ncbi:aldolase [Obba rivulosa]|uniref:Aldolase n=1 Tax=Obba rivulosa TaxID=1052685 RepID=A0A8E2B378_9APHY|nr:aldolase [Obba rivulosa]